ncbi:MAG: phosphotransferase [Thermoguttaceae bacterium]
MQRFLETARQKGWGGAAFESSSDYFASYATSHRRAAFKFLLQHFQNGVVLDYGCGPGAVTCGVADNFHRVLATDLTFERAELTSIRARQAGNGNVYVFCSGDLQHIPLQDRCVDVVILDGVLEWIPESRAGDPREAQIEFLREIRRILKPAGVLFIGIENRMGYGYLRGRPEDHTGLRFGALLPRWIANLYSQVVRGRPYRTYTYTRRGYTSLLRAAGFGPHVFFGMSPDYREAVHVLDLNEPCMIRHFLSNARGAKRIRNRLLRWLLPWVIDSYGIVASAGNQAPEPFVCRLLENISRAHLAGSELKMEGYTTGEHVPTIHVRARAQSSEWIVQLPMTRAVGERIRIAVRNIEAVRQRAWLSPRVLPHFLTVDEYQGQFFAVQRRLPGKPLSGLSNKIRGTAIKNALDVSIALARASRCRDSDWSSIIRRFGRRYASALVGKAAQCNLKQGELASQLDRVLARAEHACSSSAEGWTCAVHGDYWADNLLCDSSGRITGVLDWDRFEETGLPLMDVLHLVTYQRYQLGTKSWGSTVCDVGRDMACNVINPHLVAYLSEMELPPLSRAILPLYWMRHVGLQLQTTDVLRQTAVRSELLEPIAYFTAQ